MGTAPPQDFEPCPKEMQLQQKHPTTATSAKNCKAFFLHAKLALAIPFPTYFRPFLAHASTFLFDLPSSHPSGGWKINNSWDPPHGDGSTSVSETPWLAVCGKPSDHTLGTSWRLQPVTCPPLKQPLLCWSRSVGPSKQLGGWNPDGAGPQTFHPGRRRPAGTHQQVHHAGRLGAGVAPPDLPEPPQHCLAGFLISGPVTGEEFPLAILWCTASGKNAPWDIV